MRVLVECNSFHAFELSWSAREKNNCNPRGLEADGQTKIKAASRPLGLVTSVLGPDGRALYFKWMADKYAFSVCSLVQSSTWCVDYVCADCVFSGTNQIWRNRCRLYLYALVLEWDVCVVAVLTIIIVIVIIFIIVDYFYFYYYYYYYYCYYYYYYYYYYLSYWMILLCYYLICFISSSLCRRPEMW